MLAIQKSDQIVILARVSSPVTTMAQINLKRSSVMMYLWDLIHN